MWDASLGFCVSDRRLLPFVIYRSFVYNNLYYCKDGSIVFLYNDIVSHGRNGNTDDILRIFSLWWHHIVLYIYIYISRHYHHFIVAWWRMFGMVFQSKYNYLCSNDSGPEIYLLVSYILGMIASIYQTNLYLLDQKCLQPIIVLLYLTCSILIWNLALNPSHPHPNHHHHHHSTGKNYAYFQLTSQMCSESLCQTSN